MESARINNCFTEEDYYNLPDDMHAELIDGKFYDMASPNRTHQEIVGYFIKKIGNYIDAEKGSCKIYPGPFAVKLFNDRNTIVEPDISVICDPDKLTDKGCSGAPDWIVEVASPTNTAHDYVRKLNLYVKAGVREYWIVDPMVREISVYYFEQSSFPTSYTFEDKVKVNIYDSLWIDFQELPL